MSSLLRQAIEDQSDRRALCQFGLDAAVIEYYRCRWQLDQAVDRVVIEARALCRSAGLVEISAPHPEEQPMLRAIRELVCDYFSLTPSQLVAPDRHQELVWPRQVAIYLARHFTRLSANQIGLGFGRDGNTVRHAIQAVQDRLETEPYIARELAELRTRLVSKTVEDSPGHD